MYKEGESMTKIFHLDNLFNYNDIGALRESKATRAASDAYTGICMGATALWCLNAMRGSFRFNPHKHLSDLNRAKKLTNSYVGKISGGYTSYPVYNQLVPLHLNQLLAKVKIKGTVTPNPGGRSDTLIAYIKNNPGIYMIIGGSHVMGVSSVMDNYYLFDNMTGLYEFSTKANLDFEIRRIRGEDEWNISAQPVMVGGYQTGGLGWHGVKCEYFLGHYEYRDNWWI